MKDYDMIKQMKGGKRMSEWFTIEKIDDETYAISEYKHWEQMHSYLVLGSVRACLIDTGLGVENIRKTVEQITDLPVLVTTTHVHWDHIGSHRYFDDLAVHEKEVDWLAHFPVPLSVVKANLLRDECAFPKNFDPAVYTVFQGEPNHVLKDNDEIELGGRSLRVIHTPGHSPGHCCYYDESRGQLFSGDIIYSGTLDAFYPTTDPTAFMRSIKRVQKLSVSRILPAHYQLDIATELIIEIDQGIMMIEKQGLLKQGSGLFTFDHFKIHI